MRIERTDGGAWSLNGYVLDEFCSTKDVLRCQHAKHHHLQRHQPHSATEDFASGVARGRRRSCILLRLSLVGLHKLIRRLSMFLCSWIDWHHERSFCTYRA